MSRVDGYSYNDCNYMRRLATSHYSTSFLLLGAAQLRQFAVLAMLDLADYFCVRSNGYCVYNQEALDDFLHQMGGNYHVSTRTTTTTANNALDRRKQKLQRIKDKKVAPLPVQQGNARYQQMCKYQGMYGQKMDLLVLCMGALVSLLQGHAR